MIRLRDVNISYPSSLAPTQAVQDINIEIGTEFLGLLGPSGCGKTTLLRALAGLVRPDSGTIEFDGTGEPSYGIVFQDYSLLPWLTARENIELGLRLQYVAKPRRAAASERLLKSLNLEDAAHLFPHQLSGGMRQRVAIARAFAPAPELLLMDEPFGALDAFTREDLQEALTALYESEPKTIIFVTHDIEEALLLCDRICVLTPRPGRVRALLEVPFPRPREFSLKRDRKFQQTKIVTEELMRPRTTSRASTLLQNT